MSTKNRGDRIQLLQKVVTKHYTPVFAPEDRSVLEHLLYACCLEDAPYDAADEAFHRLQESFFDWNEVRVTTVSELCETLHNLPDPAAAALRIKRNLQSLFETRYSFDIDDMIKMNQGKAVQELEKLAGMTKFVLAYVTQNALGGHSIPVGNSIMQILLATEIVSSTEAEKGQTPGLERTVPKTKGTAFASCLHQLALEFAKSPGSKQTKAIMKEAGAVEPKKPAESKSSAESPKPADAKKSTEKKPSKQAPAVAKSDSGSASSKKISSSKKTESKTTVHKSTDKTSAKSKGADKPKTSAPAKPPGKKIATKKPVSKSGTSKKSTKRKPR